MAEHVAVCICSYRRPKGLERLLRALDLLEFAKVSPPEIQVIVVDNDPSGSASAVCASLSPNLRWPLRYEIEPRRGISQARNRALACAAEWANFAAFLDDDEVPTPGWLDELLHVQKACGADGVAGPVLPRFEEAAPAWVREGKFFESARYATGEHYRAGKRFRPWGTGNVLLRMGAVQEMDQLFDPRLGLTGGEDTDFFLRFTGSGFSLVWGDDAVVHEWIPPARLRARWILQREYRSAGSWSQCDRRIRPTALAEAERVGRALLRIGQGIVLLPFSFRGRNAHVQALRYVARGTGQLAGLMGLRYREYNRVEAPAVTR